jgi:uroporphyrinogen III methyltransferase/synthase
MKRRPGAARRPLDGRRILVTRRPEQSGALVERLVALGALVRELATIEIVPPGDTTPLDRALGSLHHYHWLVFTSANAVDAVAERIRALGLESSLVGGATRVASVGSSTTDAVRERFPGAEIALQPIADFRAEGLVEAFQERGVHGQRLLLPVSDRARDVLARALVAAGGQVDVVTAYCTAIPPQLRDRFQEILLSGLDLATFASPSAVENLAAACGPSILGLPTAVIGPVTADAARAAGFDVRAVADPSTAAGLVAAVVRYFAGGRLP